jgi:hypothetical protein
VFPSLRPPPVYVSLSFSFFFSFIFFLCCIRLWVCHFQFSSVTYSSSLDFPNLSIPQWTSQVMFHTSV